MKLEPIGDFSQRSRGFLTVRGGDDRREIGFMEATASPPHSGPNESAASTPPVAAATAPRATIMSFFSGISALTGTNNAVTTPPRCHTP